ncbi:MAG: mannitol dehydrogenase family protein [Rhizobiaceae bacterium]|nr:mannitol dehydrogenase family protein [Rhizobiaceae bacterium]
MRLSEKTLHRLRPDVQRPTYDRGTVLAGILHIGVGAFHRAHQAPVIDDCLAAGQKDWAILGASLRSTATRDALSPQDFCYGLSVRDGDSQSLRVVGSLLDMISAPENPSALLDAMVDPRIRIVMLTVTEKAYLRRPDGSLDADHGDVVHDLANPDMPRTVHGLLTEALARRFEAGTQPFTLLSCDNLPANGKALRQVIVDFAGRRSPVLADQIARHVAFPSCMVDRIVPATADGDRERISAGLGLDDAWPVVAEPFFQWVVEDDFPAGRPRWERFGVTMVEDVTPYETMKLRMLNGAHSAIAYLGLLAGHATVDAAFADPAIRAIVEALWDETSATLPGEAGLDPLDYRRRLAARFANTALAHQTRQIATDGSQKLPQRIIAPALERLEAGRSIETLALVVAAWIAACAARGGDGTARRFTDPLDARLDAIFAGGRPTADLAGPVFEAAGFASGSRLRDRLIAEVGKASAGRPYFPRSR